MATYDPLDFHGGGYGSSWQFEYDDHGYDRGYGRRSSRSSGYGHGAGAYGGEDYDARSYGAYDRGEPRRSSYEDGYGDRGGYGRSDYYGDSDRRNGFGASSSSYRYGEYRGRDYTDRGYDTRSREYGGTSSYDSRSRGYGGGGDDRSYRGYDRRVELVDGGGHHRDGGDRAARRNGGGRRDGRCSDQHREGRGGSGAGLISGSGYETIGDDITDPHLKAEWSGAAGLRNVKSDDPEVLKTVDVCARPPAPGRNGRTVPLKVNYFGLEIVSGPNQVFKYHVTVERTSDREEDENKRAGKETWLPIELCKVVPGQHCANSDDLDSPAITKLTAVPPATREKNILDRVKKAEFSQDPFLVTFGMKVKLKMEVTNARILEPPCVQYQNTSERPTNGEWSLKDKIMVKGESFDNWGVLILDQVDSSVVRRFARTLCDVGRQRGLPFKKNTEPIYVHQNEHRDADVEELMRICFQRVAERGPPEMLLVVLPDTRSWHYGPVKVMSDTVLGVSCQCVASKNLRKANAAFCANVCLKLNMRLNGKNAVLYDPLPLLSTSPTIVIGADVEHPRPGMGSQPSIAAVVASMDAYSAQYAARVGAQKASNDIQKLPTMLCELFHAYYQLTQRKPEHVVYYRDGVGDGQYSNILQAEIGALRKAFKMISENYSPPITFIVANKRHHTRAFPVDRRDADRKGNVKPGTVIDAGVVDPHRFDFFLFGHSSLQGTSKPCHYTVLYDENKLSVDDIQRLTYHLGYAFSRSTHAVSVAAPVYYANEAAAHARHFLKEVPEDESAESVSGSKFLFAKLHKNVLNKMFFI
ncbi:Argonaute5 (AGO5) [Phytophthora cinnamomi]|uniref:Argonaute5 (AGO5) n=1 Tax=Phytophthora cinnamomi TaxID=4785 RepID=UPI003559983D|nr:Argonaute5 (AGO5) [Phytophthora cinnamomi]